MSHLFHEASGFELDPLAPRGETTTPGKRALTQSLTPRSIVFRVESADAARELGAAFGPRDRNGVAGGAEAAVDRAAGSGGEPLRADLQRRFETSLGSDLSAVRLHRSEDSAAASAAVGARAYTVGNDIHFGAGQYRPDDPFGLHLIAHEVAHTRQQADGTPHRQHKLEVSSPGDAAEVEADRAADAMVAGQPASVGGAAPGALRRQPAQSCDQTGQLMAIMDGLCDVDAIRDLKYAITDAELDESNQTRVILYADQTYVVSLHGADQLMEAIAEKEGDTVRVTSVNQGLSISTRVDQAIQAKDYEQMAALKAGLDAAAAFYQPGEDWLVRLDSEEVRTDEVVGRAAIAKLAKAAPKSLDEMSPDNVSLKSLNVTFQLAKNRQIANGLGTGDAGSSVWIGLSREQLGIRFNPPLESELQLNAGDVPTADVEGAALIFATGKIVVNAKGLTAGLVADEIRPKLEAMIAGSGFEVAGYDPFADPYLKDRFEMVKEGVMNSGGPAVADQVTAKDVKNVTAAAQVKLGAIRKLDEKQTGLVIDDGSVATVAFASGGSVAGDDLATLGKLTVSTSGATLLKEGKPVVKLKKVSVGKGGVVKLEEFELLGEAKDVGDLESFLRILGGAARLAEGGVPDEAAVEVSSRSGGNDPALVRGGARYEIEKQLGAEIKKMVEANRDVELGGKTLGEIMGM